MAAIWKGVIAFGLVSIPIRVNAATSSHDLSLHQYHGADGGRVRYQKVCELDDEVLQPGDIVKGWETADGVVLLDDDDLLDLPVSSSKTIEVVRFVEAEQIDPINYQSAYYLEPERTGARPYVLLREALLAKDRLAIVKVTLRRRESLAALRPRGEALVLHTMFWPDEVRKPQLSDVDVEAREAELEMAGTLIDAMSGEFHPDEYSDDYQEALADLIEARKAGRAAPKGAKPQPKAQVIDLMEALQKSVEQKAKRPAKKSAKKATARKSTAKKAAKKSTARDKP